MNEGIKKIEIINLTPHEVNIYNEQGDLLTTVPASGIITRISVSRQKVGELNKIPIFENAYGDVENAPEEKEGIIYITSAMVSSRLKRLDMYAPGELMRDSEGKIIGCIGLVKAD